MVTSSKALEMVLQTGWLRFLHERFWSGPAVLLAPLILAAACIVGVVWWGSTLGADEGRPVTFRMAVADHGLDPGSANRLLRGRPSVEEMSTELATSPIYMLLDLRGLDAAKYLYLPVGYAISVTCWDAATGQRLGAANRSGLSEGIFRAGSGFVVPLANAERSTLLRCEGLFNGPARVRWLALTEAQLRAMGERHHRLMGTLDGGSVMLMAVMLITAVVTRTKVYGVFALWAAANWRLAEQVLGSGSDLLTLRLPGDLVVPVGLTTVYVFMVANYLLFVTLFQKELDQLKAGAAVKFLRAGVILAAVLLLVAPTNVFVGAAWAIAGYLIAVIFWLMARMVREERRGMSALYCLMLCLSLSATLYLVVSVAMGVRSVSDVVFGVANTILSTLLATLAVASKLHAETKGRQELSEQLQRSYERSPIGLFTLNATGRLISCNKAFSDLSGLAPGPDTAGWVDLIGSNTWKRLHAAAETSEGAATADIKRNNKVFEISLMRIGRELEGSLQDVTAIRAAQAHQMRLATYDALTDTLNPGAMEAAVAQMVSTAARTGECVYLLAFDLERLGSINDLFGHQTGDLVLAEAAVRIDAALPESAVLSRAGGDAFLAAMPGNADRARDTALRCLAALTSRRIVVDGISVTVDAHAGGCAVRGGFRDAKAAAELACRTARRTKVKALLDVDTPDLQTGPSLSDARQLAGRLRTMPGLRELTPGFIPYVDLDAPHPARIAYEVVPMLTSSQGRAIPYSTLMLAAEIWGSTDELDLWTLRAALQEIKITEPSARVRVAVTLAGATVANQEGARRIVQLVQDHIEDAQWLAFRLPQTAALADATATKALAARLAGYRCLVILGDLSWTAFGEEFVWDEVWSGIEIGADLFGSTGTSPAAAALLAGVATAARARGAAVFASSTDAVSEFPHASGALHQVRAAGLLTEIQAARSARG